MAKSQKKYHKKGSQKKDHKKRSQHKNRKKGSQKKVHKKGSQRAGMYRPPSKFKEPSEGVGKILDELSRKKQSTVLTRKVKEFLREPDSRRYAKVHLIDGDEDLEKIRESGLESVLDDVRYGDLVENTQRSGYRTNGIQVIGISADKETLELQNLDHTVIEYGFVGQGFSLGPNYPVGYWSSALDSGGEKAYWHGDGNDDLYEPIHREIIKSIKESDLNEEEWDGKPEQHVTFNWGPKYFKPSILIFEGTKKEVMRIITEMPFADYDGTDRRRLKWSPTGSYAYFRIGEPDNYATYAPPDELGFDD